MEEHRLRMFENRVPRIFELKWDEVIGGWEKLHNDELHDTKYNYNERVKEDEKGGKRGTHEREVECL
jgi:hypothetical protein